MDPVVVAVLEAAADVDWARFKELVHPYVHWTDGEVTLRGRTRVIQHLSGQPAPATSYELRDGQVYRWNA
jgi:hypothetical protein